MSDLSRRDAFLCLLLGAGIGLLVGLSIRGAWGPGPFWSGPVVFPQLFAGAFGLFWLFFWLLLIRGLFWGPFGRWRSWRGGRGGYYAGRLEDLPADFDDWHCRAHERMKEASTADDPGRRG